MRERRKEEEEEKKKVETEKESDIQLLIGLMDSLSTVAIAYLLEVVILFSLYIL